MKRFERKSEAGKEIDTRYIGVLDGVRAIAVIFVLIFHFWQQTWITPKIRIPFLKFLGLDHFSAYNMISAGYELVDLMIFLSGFCLFLPYARAMIQGGKTDSIRTFYKKRMARILPSYYFCVLAFFIYNLAAGTYSDTAYMLKDLFTHLTFTQMFFIDTYISTKLNVVLWTICIEVWFYILFPFLARAFQKKPVLTYAGMTLVSLGYIQFYALAHTENMRMLVNSFPSFLCVFANGMMGAVIVVALSQRLKREKYTGLFFTGLCVLSMAFIYWLLQYQLGALEVSDAQVWQIKYRWMVSFVYAVFVISLIFSWRGLRCIFANRLMHFLAGISMNLYIWHQQIAVYLKQWRVPSWEGDTPPNQLGDTAWQWKYAILITAVSFAAAILTTYLIEKPCANLILKKDGRKRHLLSQRKEKKE